MPRSRAAAALAGLAALLLAGCSVEVDPPLIRTGTACTWCNMEVEDLHFACERLSGGRWRVYDSIDCLMSDGPRDPPTAVYLPDYERYRLHRADSMFVVRGSFVTPMGEGFAAFFARAEADTFAFARRGTVGRLEEFKGTLGR
jgi:nitrous oxide reductase accessory protein NosL